MTVRGYCGSGQGFDDERFRMGSNFVRIPPASRQTFEAQIGTVVRCTEQIDFLVAKDNDVTARSVFGDFDCRCAEGKKSIVALNNVTHERAIGLAGHEKDLLLRAFEIHEPSNDGGNGLARTDGTLPDSHPPISLNGCACLR